MNIINEMLVDKCFPDNVNARAVVPAYKDKTASGNPITLTDSVENKSLGMKLYGWSKQDGTPSPDNPVEIESAGMKWSTGKNLFHITKESDCDKAYDNTTKRIILPGEYLIGLSSNNYYIAHDAFIDFNTDNLSFVYSGKSGYGVGIGTNCQKNKTYAFSFETNKGAAYAVFYSEDGAFKAKVLISTYNVFFIPDYVEHVVILLTNNDGAVAGDTIWFKNVQIEESSSPTTYEPYTGGIPKPYGDKVGVVVGGANIFSFENFIALETYSDSGYDVRNIQLKPDTMYYFYVPNRKSNAEVGVWLFQPKSENNINDVGFIGLTTNYEEVHSIKTDSTGILKIGCAFSLGIRDENYLNDNLIISLNPVDAYEPYRTPQSTAIVTPNGLPGIPVPSNTAGITYTDADGQSWIADEIDLERGKYVQRVWQAEFDGSEKRWVLYKHVQYSGFAIKVLPHEKMMRRYGLCTQYKTENLTTSNEAIWIGVNDDVLYVKNSRFYDASLDDRGLSNFKAHLAANPLVVMTYLDTPIERDLTSAELEEYTQLYSYKPTTVVENDSDCWMDVTYKAGTSGKSKNEALRWYFKNVMPLVG